MSTMHTSRTTFNDSPCLFRMIHAFTVYASPLSSDSEPPPSHLLALVQKALQDFHNLVPNLLGSLVSTEILGPKVITSLILGVQHSSDRTFDQGSLFGLAERVSEHHGGGKDGSDRVGDRLTGDIGCGTVNAVGARIRVSDERSLELSRIDKLTVRKDP